MKSVGVFCGSNSGSSPEFRNQAYKLGKILAEKNIKLIYGGAKVGLMGAVADGALRNGGEVMGILPVFLKRKELAYEGLTDIIIVDTMHERKAKMYELSDGIIALPGGFGTMDELFEIMTWAQLALHNKSIGILNINGYYDSLIKFLKTMVDNKFLKQDYYNMILVDNDIDNLLIKMNNYIPPANDKWFVTY